VKPVLFYSPAKSKKKKEENIMVVVLKKNPDPKQLRHLTSWIESMGIKIHMSEGSMQTVMGLVGDTTRIDTDLIEALDIVEAVKRIQEPYKDANRKFHAENTVIKVGEAAFGSGECPIIAGPCSVESEEQLMSIARSVKAAGAKLLRGGAFKPRTSPYAFQGLAGDGIRLLSLAKKETGLPIVSEIMDISKIDMFEDVDIIQIGARNMQNFELLKEIGKAKQPILLKRGLANTLQELLMSAEYIMASGNKNVILCERGIRTFETATRNTLDLSAIPMLKSMTHLPVIVDPSHASGIAALVKPMSMAAAACGADGLIIEVHNDPKHALCDGPQSITPEEFSDVAENVRRMNEIGYRG
jgi:3-deoxy-7-phosphoheptulonate synthase